jgi:hypothetical protein
VRIKQLPSLIACSTALVLRQGCEAKKSQVADTVIPIVYNIYNKTAERNFTEETASAILDAERRNRLRTRNM